MKKLLLFISLLSLSLLLVGCGNSTSREVVTTTATPTTVVTTAKPTETVTTTKSNEDRAKALYRKLLSALCQYNGRTLELNGKLTMNDSALIVMDYAFGINLGDNSTETLYFTLASQFENLYPTATIILNLKVVKPGQFEDYLYLNINKDFIIFTKYFMEAGKEDFDKEAFYNRDDIKNATDKDIVINLESLMSKEIKIADSLTFTIRTIVSQIFATQTIGSSVNSFLSTLKTIGILDNDYILNVDYLKDTAIQVIYAALVNDKTENPVELKGKIIDAVNSVVAIFDHFTLKETPNEAPWYLGFESEEVDLFELIPEIKKYLPLSGDDYNVKLDLTAYMKNDYFIDYISFKIVKIERTELATRESSLVELKTIFSKTLNEDIKPSDNATEVSIDDLMNIFK